MRALGYIFIVAGVSLLLFAGYKYLTSIDRVVSPVPEEKGVRVIIVTPTK